MSEMVITCPDCDTRYAADPNSIGESGRTVRCARCGGTWFVPAPDTVDTLVKSADRGATPNNDRADDLADALALAETQTRSDAGPHTFGARTSLGELSPAQPVSAVPTVDGLAPPTDHVGADVMMRDRVHAARLARRRRTIAIIWIVPLILVLVAAILSWFNRQAIVNRLPQMASLYQWLGTEVRANGLEIDPPVATAHVIDGAPVIRVQSVVRNLTAKTRPVPLIELTLHDAAGQSLAQWYVEPPRLSLPGRDRMDFQTEYADPPQGARGLRYRFADEAGATQQAQAPL